MLDIIFKVVEAIVGAVVVGAAVGGTIYVIANWPEIKDAISSWLRKNNLSKSTLMSALVIFDKIAVGIRRRIIVKTPQTGTRTIEEKTFSEKEIRKEEPDVYKQLQTKSRIKFDVMDQIQ